MAFLESIIKTITGQPRTFSYISPKSSVKTPETYSTSFYHPFNAKETKANPDGIGALGVKVQFGDVAISDRTRLDELKQKAKIGKFEYITVPELKNVETKYGKGVFRIADVTAKKANIKHLDFVSDNLYGDKPYGTTSFEKLIGNKNFSIIKEDSSSDILKKYGISDKQIKIDQSPVKTSVSDVIKGLPAAAKKVGGEIYNTIGGVLIPGATPEELRSPSFLGQVIKGLPSATKETAKQLSRPEGVGEAVLGAARGVSDSITDIIINNFVSKEDREGTRTEVQRILDKYIAPVEGDIMKGFQIGGTAAPFVAAGGIGGEAGGFLGKLVGGTTGKVTGSAIGNIAGFVGAGQSTLPKESDAELRAIQATKDLAMLGFFHYGSKAFTEAKNIIKKGIKEGNVGLTIKNVGRKPISVFGEQRTQLGWALNEINKGNKIPKELEPLIEEFNQDSVHQIGKDIIQKVGPGKYKILFGEDTFSKEALADVWPAKDYVDVKDWRLLQEGQGVEPEQYLGAFNRQVSKGEPVLYKNKIALLEDFYDNATAKIKTSDGEIVVNADEIKIAPVNLSADQKSQLAELKGATLFGAKEISIGTKKISMEGKTKPGVVTEKVIPKKIDQVETVKYKGEDIPVIGEIDSKTGRVKYFDDPADIESLAKIEEELSDIGDMPADLRAEIEAEIKGEVAGGDIIGDIVSGKLKMRPPSGDVKTDWMESIGKGNYARIFGGGKFAKTPDEVATDMGIAESGLISNVAERLGVKKVKPSKVKATKLPEDYIPRKYTPKEMRIANIKEAEAKKITSQLKRDIEALGGYNNETLIKDLNEIAGYDFKSMDDLMAEINKEAKIVKQPRIKTTGNRDVDILIRRVELMQRKDLSRAQKEAIKKLHTIAKPSPATTFYRAEERNSWIRAIKEMQDVKKLSNMTVSRIKNRLGIENIRLADQPKLQRLYDFLTTLKEGDSFLSEKQLKALSDLLKDVKDADLIPKRVIFDMFGETTEIMNGLITGKIANELIPTVDIKEGHPIVKRIVENADASIVRAEKEIQRRNEKLNEMLLKAEKSRRPKLKLGEKVKRFLIPQNKEIFKALSGEKVDLTVEERAVVAYLKNFFNKVKEDLELEKYRKHYITHLEKPLTEKIVNEGLMRAVYDVFSLRKKETIPISIMLELDNIIGSEKFFKFAMERKGGVNPTTNIRRIIHEYSSLYEMKKALDAVLPEGQAVTKLLLQNKTAVWMKKFLQNLKGRGLDYEFRRGKMGWLSKVADQIIDVGYVKLLGLNYWSALKNLAAGEANSFIYQDLKTYLTGKKRMIENPRKAIKMAQEYGALEGMYADYATIGAIGKLKKLESLSMIGQKAGEYEIRASIFAGELTPEEWASGKISSKRYEQIRDTIAITQGIFSKTQSPLWVQAWYGRLFFQMNRWRITNSMLIRRLVLNSVKEQRSGVRLGKATKQLSKAFILYGIGMYLNYELGKAGYKKAAQVAESMAQVIQSTIELLTLKPIIDSLSDNPTFSVLKELSFSIQELANYIRVPGQEEPRTLDFQQGLEKTWIAPVKTIEDITGAEETSTPKANDILKKYNIKGSTKTNKADEILKKYNIK